MKSLEQVAHEVINGLWGNGSARKAALEAAGYDYNLVQATVNAILNGTFTAPVDDSFKIGTETFEVNIDLTKYGSLRINFEV